MYDALLTTKNSAIITVNERLSRYLIERKLTLMQRQDERVLAQDTIFSSTVWSQKRWQEALMQHPDLPIVISPLHRHDLWQTIIRTHNPNTLINTKDLADVAIQTNTLMAQYCLTASTFTAPLTTESQAYLTWHNAYHALLQQNNWLDPSEILTYLLQHIDLSILALPQQLHFIGFTQLTPQLEALRTSLTDAGVRCHIFTPSTSTATKKVFAFTHTRDEYYAALSKGHALTQKTNTTMAIVVPDLQTQREAIEQLIADIEKHPLLAPNQSASAFMITGGRALTAFPIIYLAYQLLNAWHLHDQHAFSQILLSPFIAGSIDEQDARAQVDLTLKRKQPKSLSFLAYLTAIPQGDEVSVLHTIRDHVSNLERPKKASPAQWTCFFQQILDAWGWPGARGLSSAEHQCVKRFFELLDQLATIGTAFGDITYQHALQKLEYLLQHERFQHETTQPARVHIMGTLETAGLPFDYIWLTGVNDQTFPATPKPNPFIPLSIQKERMLPHASSKRETDFAVSLLAQLDTQTPTLYLSYAKQCDRQENTISPLINDYPVDDTLHPQQIFTPQATLTSVEDTYGRAPALQSLKGGSTILKRQSHCPFSAHAAFRLNVSAFPEPLDRLDFIDRGTLIHRILEGLWQELGDHHTLITLTDDALLTRARTLTHQALMEHQKKYPSLLPPNLFNLEHQRLSTLTYQWLKHEQERPSFKVTQIEQTCHVEFCQLPLTLRIDRVDTLASGEQLIIDYKTGTTSASHWFSDRPLDPQLPLYVLCTQAQGIAFAKVNITKPGFDGIMQDNPNINGIRALTKQRHADKTTWQAQQDQWKTVLSDLANAFKKGYAAVDPASTQACCTHCEFKRLCRV